MSAWYLVFLALSAAAALARARVLRPLPGRDQLMEIRRWWYVSRMFLSACVKSVMFISWLDVSRSRHCAGRVGSVEKILISRMELVSCKVGIARVMARVSDL